MRSKTSTDSSGSMSSRAGPAGQLDREVGRVPLALDVHRVEVTGVLGMGGARLRRVAVDQRTRVERREQPLVRIDDERVGLLDAGEQSGDARRRQSGSAI